MPIQEPKPPDEPIVPTPPPDVPRPGEPPLPKPGDPIQEWASRD